MSYLLPTDFSNGSTLANFGRHCPLPGPIFFIFLQFFGTFGRIIGCCLLFLDWCVPSGKSWIHPWISLGWHCTDITSAMILHQPYILYYLKLVSNFQTGRMSLKEQSPGSDIPTGSGSTGSGSSSRQTARRHPQGQGQMSSSNAYCQVSGQTILFQKVWMWWESVFCSLPLFCIISYPSFL